MKTINTFAFLDETGNLSLNHPDRYFAVGAIFHPWPDETLIELHKIFEELCSRFKKDPSRMEFKFNEVTTNSLSCYLKALDVLREDKDWRFCSVVLDKKDPKFDAPQDKLAQWECYLRWVKHLIKNNIRNHEKAILLADFLRRPTGEVHKFSTLHMIIPNLEDELQVESQGLLLVQFADVFLGGSLYEGSDKVKVELAQAVNDILNNLGTSPGGKRYNRWNPVWR
jgi:hypothetical protein